MDSYYTDYKPILEEVTAEVCEPDEVPSVPQLYKPFLTAVSENEEYDLPPKGAVNSIISEHIDSVRAEERSREGVSRVKQELEQRGVSARTAAEVARSVDDYIKTDAELEADE